MNCCVHSAGIEIDTERHLTETMDLQDAQDAWDSVKEIVPRFKHASVSSSNENGDNGDGDGLENVHSYEPAEAKLITAQAALEHIRARLEMPEACVS